MTNIITAQFTPGITSARVSGIWQWDYGQVLRIQGLSLPTAVEIHFAPEGSAETITRVGVTRDGVTDVPVPDSILERAGTACAYVYLADAASGNTEYKVTMRIMDRPKPEAFNTPGDAELFREAIEAVNTSAERAEGSKTDAQAARDDARAIADGIKVEVSGMAEETKTARNTAIEHANIAANKADETEADKAATEANKASTASDKATVQAVLAESNRILQEQIQMLGTVPMIYAVTTLEELKAYQGAKEGDFGIIQEPRAMLFRYYVIGADGQPLSQPTWQWMTDLSITFTRDALLGILQLPDLALSASYRDLVDIPNRYNAPLVLDSTGDAVSWDYSRSDTAVVTLTESKPLVITGGYNGAVAVIQCYGGRLDFAGEAYNKSATLDYLEPLVVEHITYTLIYNAGRWDVSALVYAGGGDRYA